MGLKRIKISELTLSDNLKGLYTIGVKLINGVQTSVKVSLEYIQTAYENAVAATKKAETAANDANTAAGSANSAASSANSAASKANTAASNADKARENLEEIKTAAVTATNSANNAAGSANSAASKATQAAGSANTQADRAKEQADNPPKMGENGNWWKWDEERGEYVDTGILAKGGVLYPTFDINENDMILYMEFEDEISDQLIKFDKQTGELYLNVG